MKRITFITSVVVAVLMGTISCSNDEDGGLSEVTKHSEFKKVSKMLYKVTYSDYSSKAPNNDYDAITGDMACSSVRNGNFHGRNFDYFMNACPTIVVRTPANGGRYATIGVGRLAKTSEAMIEAGLPQDKIELLPWALMDGMNEKGLVVNSNVSAKNDWGEIPHTGTREGAPELNVLVSIRALLDHCATVKEALNYLDKHNVTPLASELMNLHLMISDPKETYVVEFLNNKIVAKPQYIMTNYYVCVDSIPNHASGVERYKILAENYDKGGESMQGMWELMKMVRYSNLYYFPKYKWYSELATHVPYSIMNHEIIRMKLDSVLVEYAEEWPNELKYVEEHGMRENSDWWDTTHNTIYDIRNKKMWVTVHEWYDQKAEFSL